MFDVVSTPFSFGSFAVALSPPARDCRQLPSDELTTSVDVENLWQISPRKIETNGGIFTVLRRSVGRQSGWTQHFLPYEKAPGDLGSGTLWNERVAWWNSSRHHQKRHQKILIFLEMLWWPWTKSNFCARSFREGASQKTSKKIPQERARLEVPCIKFWDLLESELILETICGKNVTFSQARDFFRSFLLRNRSSEWADLWLVG